MIFYWVKIACKSAIIGVMTGRGTKELNFLPEIISLVELCTVCVPDKFRVWSRKN